MRGKILQYSSGSVAENLGSHHIFPQQSLNFGGSSTTWFGCVCVCVCLRVGYTCVDTTLGHEVEQG